MSDGAAGSETTGLEIAIIGMDGRFPGAQDVGQFWQNVAAGVESISFFDDDELLAAGVDPALLAQPNYVKAGALVADADMFDAAFFGYSPREAEMIDPQHRLFLECAWHALEHAGYDAERAQATIGVYAGVNMNTYLFNIYASQTATEDGGRLQALLGNDKDYLTTRVAYKLNLRGPSITVQTACSSSLVAVHLACRALLSGECDIALAGGVSVNVPQQSGYLYQPGGLHAADGHCRTFDADAQGTVFGSGVGIVVLKRLEDALTDSDSIHAVIKGSAINNDGALKVGFTAPGVEGQAAVIRAAQMVAEVAPETISYVEAHGTGTPLGDPVEIAALTRVFGIRTQPQPTCAIGSVKTNIGHLNTAAGVTGLIKTVLALKHQQIPPSLNFSQPNPHIDWAHSNFYVNTQLTPWPRADAPRRAAVSSFGVGGTNAHVIIEEAPHGAVAPLAAPGPPRDWQLLVLSAKTTAALDSATINLADELERNTQLSFADAIYTLQVGRHAFDHRRFVVCRDAADAIDSLRTLNPQRVFSHHQTAGTRSIVFMFPGGGAQYINMGAELYRTQPVFREQVDACAALLTPLLDYDLRTVLYPAAGQTAQLSAQLKRTSVALPTLFTVEYALAQLLMAWGIQPAGLIGHSLGEYVAATLAGVFSLRDALALVVARGQLFEQLPSGAMLSVTLAEPELVALLRAGEHHELSLAAINAPSQCVVSGPVAAIERLADELRERAIEFRHILIDVAAHSALVEPILEPFARHVERMQLHPPRVPFISNVSGTWITAAEATNPRYWVRHLRQTVRFGAGIHELIGTADDPSARLLVEVGPGQTLSTLAGLQLDPATQTALASMRHPYDQQSDVAYLLTMLGKLWLRDASIDWAGFYGEQRHQRVPLPTYPFERQRYWIEAERPAEPAQQHRASKQPDLADWFYLPSWKRSLAPRPARKQAAPSTPRRWLLFDDRAGWGAQLAQALNACDQPTALVAAGAAFRKHSPTAYTIDPRAPADYTRLWAELRADALEPTGIVHLWGLSVTEHDASAQQIGGISLLLLAHMLGAASVMQPLQFWIVANQTQLVESQDQVWPQQTPLWGPAKVMSQEYAHLTCQYLDVVLPAAHESTTRLRGQLLAELGGTTSGEMVAYRGDQRWTQTIEPVRLSDQDATSTALRPAGVYLLIEAWDGIAALLAEHLARTLSARLILTSAVALPPRAEWDVWLANHADEDVARRKIHQIRALEQLGAQVELLHADPADHARMHAGVAQAVARFGELHGVIFAPEIGGGASFKLLQALDPGEYEQHVAAQTHTLETIAALAQAYPLDLCLVLSSNTALLGGTGSTSAAAISLLLDGFVAQQNSLNSTRWISVGWDSWLLEAGGGTSAVQTTLDHFALSADESVTAIMRALSASTGQIMISPGDLGSRLELARQRIDRRVTQPRPTATLHARPALASSYIAPTTALEQTIATVWQELLGIKEIGIDDNFFTLGGHSLLASQVIARLRDALAIEVPLRTLFEAGTIGKLAQAIEQLQGEQIDDEAWALLQMVEQLGDEHAAAELARRNTDQS